MTHIIYRNNGISYGHLILMGLFVILALVSMIALVSSFTTSYTTNVDALLDNISRFYISMLILCTIMLLLLFTLNIYLNSPHTI